MSRNLKYLVKSVTYEMESSPASTYPQPPIVDKWRGKESQPWGRSAASKRAWRMRQERKKDLMGLSRFENSQNVEMT
jgi:hypothetical protein